MYMPKQKNSKTIKYVWVLLVVTVLFCSVTGCTVLGREPAYQNARVHIVTTVFPPYDFARNITSDMEDIYIQQLLRPGMESHTYDPTPADILAVQHCDLFIYTGGESDAWVDTLLEAADNSGMQVLRMMDCVETLEEESVEGMSAGHSHAHHEDEAEHAHEDHDEIEYDEHVWTAPSCAEKITEAITDVLCEMDAPSAGLYRQNCQQYIEQLTALDAYFDEIVHSGARSTVVFGDRFPMRYLCDAYGLSYRAAFPGCAEESEPSAATMIYLIEKVKSEQIPVIFTIEMSNGKIAAAIAEETGAEISVMHSCHNRTAKEAAEDATYLSLMYQNADALKLALAANLE